jgi:hypothetical protein
MTRKPQKNTYFKARIKESVAIWLNLAMEKNLGTPSRVNSRFLYEKVLLSFKYINQPRVSVLSA